jgi:isoleucyl-tRNA synthetase
MFKPVSSKLNVSAMEDGVLKFWKRENIFKKTVEQRQGAPEYVFYEGPPTANGKPGVHHVLARAFKDMFPRYKIMRGYNVSRRGGWDTHGLALMANNRSRNTALAASTSCARNRSLPTSRIGNA